MRSIILAALLALPLTAIAALPEQEDRHYFIYYECERIVAAVGIIPGELPFKVKVAPSRHDEIARQVRYLQSRYPVTRITLPAGPECQRT